MYNNPAKLALSHRNITSWAIRIYVMKMLTKVSVADLGDDPLLLFFYFSLRSESATEYVQFYQVIQEEKIKRGYKTKRTENL